MNSLPTSSRKEMKTAISGCLESVKNMLRKECPDRRTNDKTRRFWDELEQFRKNSLTKKAISDLIRKMEYESDQFSLSYLLIL